MVGYALSQLVLSCLFGDGGWGVCVFDYKLKDSNPGTLGVMSTSPTTRADDQP